MILIFSTFNLSAQVSTVSLNFNSLVNNKDILELEKPYYFKSIQDSLQVDVLKFYISDVKFIMDETILASVHKKYFLIKKYLIKINKKIPCKLFLTKN